MKEWKNIRIELERLWKITHSIKKWREIIYLTGYGISNFIKEIRKSSEMESKDYINKK